MPFLEERLQDAKLKMSLKTKSSRRQTLSLPLNEATSVKFLESHVSILYRYCSLSRESVELHRTESLFGRVQRSNAIKALLTLFSEQWYSAEFLMNACQTRYDFIVQLLSVAAKLLETQEVTEKK